MITRIKQTAIILLFLFEVITGATNAQECVLYGTVLDGDSNEKMAYANVIITSDTDSALLFGGLTNDKGIFKIGDLSPGTYNVKISFIGYQSIILHDQVLKEGLYNLGTQKMKVLAENLEEVTVKARQPAFSYKIDRKVINAASFPSANEAIDLLENVPSVQVDLDGNLTYRGEGAFLVYVNGHPVANGTYKLRQIPVSKIDRIEIITNPSVKYDAEGTAGIIQVILKRNRLQGYRISGTAKGSTLGTIGSNFSVEKNNEAGGWYAMGNLGKLVTGKVNSEELLVIEQTGISYEKYLTQSYTYTVFGNYLEIGLNQDLSDRSYIDFSLYLNPLKVKDESKSTGNIEALDFWDNQLTKKTEYGLESYNQRFYRYLGGTFTYDYSFNKDQSHKLSTYIEFSTYMQPFMEQQTDTEQYADYEIRKGYVSNEYNEVFFEADISYKQELSDKLTFEAGFNIETDHIPQLTSISGIYNQENTIIPFAGEPLNQSVSFFQDTYAAYLLFNHSMEKLAYQFGLRSEYTRREANYNYRDDSDESITVPARKTFYDFFPSFHTVYNFSETHQLAFSYSRRIQRPDYWDLIPLSQYQTPFFYYTGNGNLLPAYSNSVEMAYKKNWDMDFIGIELFTRNTKNVIQAFAISDTSDVIKITPMNVGNAVSGGVELMTGIDFFDWWNINISTSQYLYILNVDINDASETKRQFNSDSRINNTFHLPLEFMLKFDVNYRSPRIDAQGKTEGYFFSDFSASKSFNDNSWLFALTISDVFGTKKYSKILSETDMRVETSYNIKPYVSLKITYTFDNQE
ncbi:MAG: TonB-dependent receptor family protein [Bacteroidales bacterium]|nr:TonB-dependent receptor family protein [Bacteroidales bacterium]